MAKNTTPKQGAKKQAESGSMNKMAVGVSIAAALAAAAGAAFLYGTDSGKKKREEMKSWTLRMKADVMDKMEKMHEWSEDAYHTTIDSVAKKYEGMKSINPKDVAALVADMRDHWKSISKEIKSFAKEQATVIEKGAKPKAAKKAKTNDREE
jgi:hypothetical protein